jgi:hypothetical protein
MTDHRTRPASPPAAAAPLLEAKRTASALSRRLHPHEVTYSVVDNGYEPRPADGRFARRVRTRLRSGKVFDAANRLIVEGLLYDRSATGWRLRMLDDVALPPRVRFYDDELRRAFDAKVVWKKGREVGIVLTA